MANRVRIVGVHPVEADEPVYLVEVEVEGPVGEFDFGAVTQELSGQPQGNWQTAYDEREMGRESDRVRFAFFFHDLDTAKPLLTPHGAIDLPLATPVPGHLRAIEYEQP